MGRYILRFTGGGRRPSADMKRLREDPKLTVLDDSAHMFLVEGSEEQVRRVVGSMPGWSWSPERAIRLPDSRPKPRRGPER